MMGTSAVFNQKSSAAMEMTELLSKRSSQKGGAERDHKRNRLEYMTRFSARLALLATGCATATHP